MNIPKCIKEIMTKIEKEGYEIYLVGGYVRDYILGIKNDDYDLCTNMNLNKLKELYPNIHIMKENNHRNTASIHIDNYIIEISEYKGNNLKEDLYNRDFTINALAMNKEETIIDYNNYKKDILNKTIKLVKKDGTGIDYDPLRILRALRLSLYLDFKIDINTKNIILSKINLLDKVAKERILKELIKILTIKNSTKYIEEYKEIFFYIIPELKETYNFKQYNPYHIYDVFHHTLKVVDNVDNNIYSKLAALFHDIGKPSSFFKDEKGIGHFYGHPIKSKEIFLSFANTYKLDSNTKKIVSDLIYYHDEMLSLKETKIKKFLTKFNKEHIDLLFDLKEADMLAQNKEYVKDNLEQLKIIKTKYKEVIESDPVLTEKSLAINGKDLINLGYNGKEIGIIKKKILSEIIENNLDNNKEKILKYIKKEYHK